jgi:hypothetical protein
MEHRIKALSLLTMIEGKSDVTLKERRLTCGLALELAKIHVLLSIDDHLRELKARI